MLYDLLKKLTSLFFNVLNKILGGKLPPFGSASVIVEEDNYFLAVELPGDHLVFPGGFMNWNEKPEQSAEREGQEETGLEIRVTNFIGYYPATSDRWTNMSSLGFAFAGRVIGGKMRPNIEGRPRWVHERELRQRLSPHSQNILNDYLHQRQREERVALMNRAPMPVPVA